MAPSFASAPQHTAAAAAAAEWDAAPAVIEDTRSWPVAPPIPASAAAGSRVVQSTRGQEVLEQEEEALEEEEEEEEASYMHALFE
jgi:ribosomal protein L12E/L44/L45/RPP1/RPP2